jgi:RNA polymerase sigma-70 factor (family 1)
MLLQLLRDGSEEAFNHIYAKFKKPVFLYAKRFIPDVSVAEDLAAEAFIKIWQRKEHFNSLDAIAAFLRVTIRNSCYNFLRHAGIKRLHEANLIKILEQQQHDEEPFFIEKVRLELIEMIYREVDKLPARMKEVFLLAYRDGLKPAEIAKRLRLNIQTVKNQRVTAVRILREVLQNYPAAIFLLLAMEADVITLLH